MSKRKLKKAQKAKIVQKAQTTQIDQRAETAQIANQIQPSEDVIWFGDVQVTSPKQIVNFIYCGNMECQEAALICFDFNEPIPEKYKVASGLGFSSVAGYYKYIHPRKGIRLESISLQLPTEIEKFRVGVRSWKNPKALNISSDFTVINGAVDKNFYKSAKVEIKKLKASNLKLKQTISYKLGSLILNSTKSAKNFFSLPTALLLLRKEVLLRRKLSAGDELFTTSGLNTESFLQYNNLKDIKVLTLLDPISETCWGAAFNCTALSIEDYEKQIGSGDFAFFFMESCWNANNGEWLYAQTSPNFGHANAQKFLHVIKLLRKNNIPIVFWNKEDPMHYDTFLECAKFSDVIFTTDENKVEDYKRDTGVEYVSSLKFGADIQSCAPIGRFERVKGDICFAGTYYAKDHGDRRKQMDVVLSSMDEHSGVIFDRAYGTDDERYKFPEEYHKYIKGSLPFKDMMAAYSEYKVFLNVNTIINSPTMMSRRVYELMASGTPVISTTSKALFSQFPGLVNTVKTETEAQNSADLLLSDQAYWLKKSHLGYREIHLNNGYENRALEMLSLMGSKLIRNKKNVVFIIDGKNDLDNERLIEIAYRQNHFEYFETIDILVKGSKGYSTILNKKKSKKKNDAEECYIVNLTSDYHYFDNYVIDMLLPFEFCSTDIVTKSKIFEDMDFDSKDVFSGLHSYTESISEGLTVMKISEFSVEQAINITTDNRKVYSSDPFNVLKVDANTNIDKKIYEYGTKVGI